MNPSDLVEAFLRLRSGSRDGQRLPHKPLLALIALGRWENGDRGHVAFKDVEEKLESLIQTYGPKGAGYPEDPFWRMRRDNLWELGGTEHLSKPTAVRPPARTVMRKWVTGRFPDDVQKTLDSDPALVRQIARSILENNFPPSLHADIAAAVGLDLADPPPLLVGVTPVTKRRPRSPDFRDTVLTAYGDECAICGVRMRMFRNPLGLEAAHIQWFAFDGPDEVTNGIALCALHHKAFDLGAFAVEPDGRILVSEHLTGDGGDVLLGDRPLRLKITKVKTDRPDHERLQWHREKVFKGRAQE